MKKIVYFLISFAVYLCLNSSGVNSIAFAAVSDVPTSTEQNFPYQKTFIISAYYSPLPDQEYYVRGSYFEDVKLNGRGVRGADGSDVYPGMIAAPKKYPYGTKMKIPGIGTVAVHDRGRDIVQAGEQNYLYDRLDIWMGYGDVGLRRALQWGKRFVEVIVYGIDDNLKETIALENYSEKEKTKATAVLASATFETEAEKRARQEQFFINNLQPGDKGEDVRKLQLELARINLLGVEPTGVYGKITSHAVFKFQQINGILKREDDDGAGAFGPATRGKLHALLGQRKYVQRLIAEKQKQSKKKLVALN